MILNDFFHFPSHRQSAGIRNSEFATAGTVPWLQSILGVSFFVMFLSKCVCVSLSLSLSLSPFSSSSASFFSFLLVTWRRSICIKNWRVTTKRMTSYSFRGKKYNRLIRKRDLELRISAAQFALKRWPKRRQAHSRGTFTRAHSRGTFSRVWDLWTVIIWTVTKTNSSIEMHQGLEANEQNCGSETASSG